MSYDFGLVAPDILVPSDWEDGVRYPAPLRGYDWNATYNLAPMFTKALGCSIRDLEGRKCSEIAPILQAGIEAMLADWAAYEELNPWNGWGNAEGALKTLCELARWCSEVPDAALAIS